VVVTFTPRRAPAGVLNGSLVFRIFDGFAQVQAARA
jgi:hypothetical protein